MPNSLESPPETSSEVQPDTQPESHTENNEGILEIREQEVQNLQAQNLLLEKNADEIEQRLTEKLIKNAEGRVVDPMQTEPLSDERLEESADIREDVKKLLDKSNKVSVELDGLLSEKDDAALLAMKKVLDSKNAARRRKWKL